MTESGKMRRVLLAVSEASPPDKLWHAVVEYIADDRAEIVTVVVRDDRWHRAATLPFTREISRFSGLDEDFTRQRADQVRTAMAGRALMRIRELAEETELELVFEVLCEHDAEQTEQLASLQGDVLIAPSALEGWPLFPALARLNRQIVLVDVEE